MKITTREVRISSIINYNDGCTKTIDYFKVYSGNMKTPLLKYKIVEFRYPDGKIDKDRSYDRRTVDKEYTDTDTESDSDSESDSD